MLKLTAGSSAGRQCQGWLLRKNRLLFSLRAMRQLSPYTVLLLIAIGAVLLSGNGGQVHAGVVTVEALAGAGNTSLIGHTPSWSDRWIEQQETQSCPCVQATDPRSEHTADQGPFRQRHDPGALTFFGIRALAVPGGRATSSTTGNMGLAACTIDRPTVPPTGAPSLFLTNSRTQFPDPYLSGLFRPPRCS
jgi:hypothetical protein